jgi:hypothetical protein
MGTAGESLARSPGMQLLAERLPAPLDNCGPHHQKQKWRAKHA